MSAPTAPGAVRPRRFAPDDADDVLRLAATSYTSDSRWHVGDLAWHLAVTGGHGLGDHTDVWAAPVTGSGREQVLAVSWWDRIEVTDEARAALTLVGPTSLLPRIVEHTVDALGPDVAAVDVVVLEVERDVVETLDSLGFAPVEHDEFFVNLQRDLGTLGCDGPPPSLPGGVTVTRADAHPAWAWAELHRAVWPDSTLDAADRQALTGRWPYDPAFDLVAQDDDGTLVGYVTGWLPPGASTGQLEPVGTRAPWRRRGVSRALGRMVLEAFRDAGASRALVYARGDDAYPDARATYRSMGFDVHARQLRWQRRLHRARGRRTVRSP